jgi:hypothetical protein
MGLITPLFKIVILKIRIFWVILLLLFLYNGKRYDIDEHKESPYNGGVTVDEMYRG